MRLDQSKLYYLATPYTKYHAGIWPAYKEAARIAGRLTALGISLYSPIAHSHPLAVYGGIDPLDHSFWMRVDARFVAICDALIVAKMNGWDESKGITIEIAAFATAGKPIFTVEPDSLVITEGLQ